MDFNAVLFDLDGTLVDSMASVERSWRAWAGRNGLDAEFVLENIHGRPAQESIAMLLKDSHEMEVKGELSWLTMMEATDLDDVVALDGALARISELEAMNVPWAIVTSGVRKVASARLAAAGIQAPTLMICADDVDEGKPAPQPYLMAAEKLGVAIETCLVVEDSAAGVASGMNAKASVLALSKHFGEKALAQATMQCDDLTKLQFSPSERGVSLRFID